MAVSEHLRQSGSQRVDDADVRHALLVRPQRHRLARHLIHIHHRARRLPLAREREQVADDARGAFGFAEDDFEAVAHRLFERRALRQPLGPGEDRRERVVQLVGDAGNRLPERGHFLGLQQLVIDVARLIVQLLAFAHVSDQRFDAERAVGGRLGPRRELEPDRSRVGAPQAEQVVADRAVGGEALEQRDARLGIDEALAIERPHVGVRRLAGVAEDQFEVRVGGDG